MSTKTQSLVKTNKVDEDIDDLFKEAVAHARYIRISPRKIGIVLDLIRNKFVKEAKGILKFTSKSAAEPLLKLLNSVIANAVNNYQMDLSKLYVSECFVCPGPILKRIRPMSKGRAYRIEKRSSHITIKLKENF